MCPKKITESINKNLTFINNQGSGKLFDFKELFTYRDLIFLLVRRDIIAVTKQTVLGPLWYLISPLLSSLAQFFVFGQIAKMPSDGLPYFLFVLSGNVVWSYFAVSFSSIAGTFKNYEGIFGKVYFPRAVVPFSIIISSLFQFAIKLVLLFSMFLITGNSHFFDSSYFLIPLLLIPLAILSLGLGMLITSLTTKYRDINHLLATAIGLWMYVTPVIFPTSILLKQLPNDLTWLVYINPLTSFVDSFRYCLFNVGVVSSFGYVYSFSFSIIIFVFGYMKFNKTQRSFIDNI